MPRNGKYTHVTDELRAAIRSGAIAENGRLPSEAQLMAEHGVARMTARALVDPLVREGLAYRVHGSGTFAAGRDGVEERVVLPAEMWARAQDAARRERVAIGEWVREAVRQRLDR